MSDPFGLNKKKKKKSLTEQAEEDSEVQEPEISSDDDENDKKGLFGEKRKQIKEAIHNKIGLGGMKKNKKLIVKTLKKVFGR